MPDIDKIILGLEWILMDDRFGFGINWAVDSNPQDDYEQAGYNIRRAIDLLESQLKVVRCRECKYHQEYGWCNKVYTKTSDDWFCADGERREKDE